MTTQQRRKVLAAIEQIPEEYLGELLQTIRSFQQHKKINVESPKQSWEDAIQQLENTGATQRQNRQNKIRELLSLWQDMDSPEEQQETLNIIETREDVSI
ncbi:hypothetical protein PN462_20440 [Spirulina sp. CS-785/01]|uniref:hypothetical protein n=1 Tax=Spirulina sp. CS-785/01 TaxID=3021716 RepID=UPI00232D5FB3|nr:hypothetical protein [Spirulina sp. CS-785/01]MDB9315494.1 hypothetical protein [Spirulina sp. CS-785/01]